MKRTFFVLLSVCALVLVIEGCGSSGGGKSVSCEDLCDKFGDCGGASVEANCLEGCEYFEVGMRDEPYNLMSECVVNQSCGAMDLCIYAAMAIGSPSVVDSYRDTYCDKEVECENFESLSECLEDIESSFMPLFLATWEDSYISCVTDCVDDLSCPVNSNDHEDCFEDCEVVFFFD